MTIVLVIISALLVPAAIGLTPAATAGTTVIGIACLFGIWARIAQAHSQNREAHPPTHNVLPPR